MKILNEEHFENVKHYAESIGDTSLQKCLDRLKSWEENPDRPVLVRLHATLSRRKNRHRGRTALSRDAGQVVCGNIAAVPRVADTYLTGTTVTTRNHIVLTL